MYGQHSFLKSGRLAGARELDHNGTPILDTFEAGIVYLQTHLPAYSRIFASPAVKRDGANGLSIAWYSDHAGTRQKWIDIDPASRARAASLLGQLAGSILKLAEDPADDMAQALTRWLQILSPDDDIIIIDGQPVITNWGLVPESIGDDGEALLRHFNSGLGRFLPQGVSDSARLEAVPPAMPRETQAAFSSPGASPMADTSYSERQPLTASLACGILPIAIACAVALLLLLLLLIPGVLVYPRTTLEAPALDAASLGEAEDVLRKRVEDMRNLLSQGVCRAPTNLSRIDDIGPDALARAQTPMSQSPDGTTEANAPPAGSPNPASLMPPSPSSLRPAKQTDATSVVDLVERATVLVIARTQDGETSTGTGFFVAPQRILTNRHVVEKADRSAIYVTSKALASVKPVTLQAMTETSEFGSTDFALLDLQGEPSPETLSVTTASAKGDNVLAAGFPSVFMETDLQFQSLLQGQQTAAPQMVVTDGIVTVFQTSPSGVPLLLHSADISPGNSGGPLVDYCGRVVGVNTFLRTNTDNQMRLNFALKTDSLVGFLRANQVPVDAPTEACMPLVNAGAATPSTAGP